MAEQEERQGLGDGLFRQSAHDLPAEELLDKYAIVESKRDETGSDKGHRELSIGVRELPAGMMMALAQIRRRTGHSIATITKCFSHTLPGWCASIPEMAHLSADYEVIADICSDHAYNDLQKEADAGSYEYRVSEPVLTATGTTTIKTIGWVNADVAKYSKPVGCLFAKILCVGLCRCICLNEQGWADGTIRTYLEPEINNFLWYLKERAVVLKAYRDIASLRMERDAGKQNGETLPRKLGNGSDNNTI